MTVSILIVSHSADVARGTAEMVRQMTEQDLAVAWSGGNPTGGLGTNATKIARELNAIWQPDGVAILVDVGGAETNSEKAIELLSQEKAKSVRICQAPLVEGAIMAAAEAASGGSLDQVCSAAEELPNG